MNKHTLFIAIIAGVIGALLLAIGILRYNDIYKNHTILSENSTQNLAHDTELFVHEHQRLVKLFGSIHVELIRALADDPENTELEEKLFSAAEKFFPNLFSLTVSDENGNRYIEDFTGRVGDFCLNDLKEFVKSKNNFPRIHPNAEGYHFDILSEITSNEKNFILFISFRSHILSKAILSAQVPGHQLLITYPTENGLIEATSNGPRNTLDRDSYLLSDKESARSMSKTKIEGTSWFAEDLHKPKLFHDIKMKIIVQFSFIYIMLLGICTLLIIIIRKEALLKSVAEAHKNSFVSSVSHELRTPITSISGTISLVANGVTGEIPPKAKEMLDMAQRNCSRLTFLINDLLDVQKIEAGMMQYDIKEHDIAGILEKSIKACDQFITQYNVKYNLNITEIDFKTSRVIVKIDENRIIQVLHNLFSNAAKYGAKNDIIDVKLWLGEDVAIIDVIDHGEGIPPDIKKDLFRTFSRSTVHADKNIQGTGLGLNISKKIIEKHGGSISVKSSPGHTCFTVTLPISEIIN
ncbi:MAG: HAMP domain-containing histidine kinase [Sulfuriflexus sp.]|nr:HAMP domain-containing histidine kinase [Sulfuriflexus sp.]